MVQLPSSEQTLECSCLKTLPQVGSAVQVVELHDINASSDLTRCTDKAGRASSSVCVSSVNVLCSGDAASHPTANCGDAWSAARNFRKLRCGHASDQGRRLHMEDAHVMLHELGSQLALPCPPVAGMLAVFDGHHGSHAAEFASQRILQGVTNSTHFPVDISSAMVEAFVQIDEQYHDSLAGCTGESAGTTALAALVWGNMLYVANAGDSRAVLSQSGRALELSRDHKPVEPSERQRIEASGGFVCSEGMLNGELGVARAIGDYHLPDVKQLQEGALCPLTAVPEVTTHLLQEGDEFLLLGCDGLWDVFSSQRAVEFARVRLRHHNDPQRCARELVDEALSMHSGDNITVICCCFGEERPKRRVYAHGRLRRAGSSVHGGLTQGGGP